MMEGETAASVNLARVEDTKRCLSSYKEILSVAWEVLTWKHEWYSVVLVVAVTLFYSLIWWNDVTVLTTLSLVGIVAVCLDLASVHGRGLLGSVVAMNPDREREFVDLCVWLSQASASTAVVSGKVAGYRESNPLIFYTSMSTLLLFLAWIGSSVPNMLLCYWATVVLVLAPGLSRSGLVAKYAGQVYTEVQKLLRRYLPVKKTPDAAKQE